MWQRCKHVVWQTCVCVCLYIFFSLRFFEENTPAIVAWQCGFGLDLLLAMMQLSSLGEASVSMLAWSSWKSVILAAESRTTELSFTVTSLAELIALVGGPPMDVS